MQRPVLFSLLSISFLMAAVWPLEGCGEDTDLGGNLGPDGAAHASDGSRSVDAPRDGSITDAGPDAPTDTTSGSSDGSQDDVSPSACAPVTFRMQAAAGDAGYSYVFGDYLSNLLILTGHASWWYSVATADGAPLQIFLEPSVECEGCFVVGNLPVGPGTCAPLPDGGAAATWNGSIVTGSSMCDAVSLGLPLGPAYCQVTGCAPAGNYVATLCAYALDDCLVGDAGDCPNANYENACLASVDGGVCVSVPFEYPTTAEVVGTLPPF